MLFKKRKNLFESFLKNIFSELHLMKAYKGGKSSENSQIDPNLLHTIKKYEKEGRKVMANESEVKYSNMLLQLVKPYHNTLPEIDELEALLEIATIAWNIATMKKFVPQAHKMMLEETKNDLGHDKISISILEKLVKAKEKMFGKHDMFIHEFDIKDTLDGQFYVTVTAKPLESFLSDGLLEDDDKDEDLELTEEPGYINRNAFTITPRATFLEWLKKTEGNSLFPITDSDDAHIYLLEEKDSNEEIELWLQKNFDRVFKKELEAWYSDEKLWPQKRTYLMFKEWFDISYQSMIYDLENSFVDKDIS